GLARALLSAGALAALTRLARLALGQARQAVEVALPHRFQESLERPGVLPVGSVEPRLTGPPTFDEPSVLQDPEVLGHGRPADVEVRRDLAGRQLAVPDEPEDLAPARARY